MLQLCHCPSSLQFAGRPVQPSSSPAAPRSRPTSPREPRDPARGPGAQLRASRAEADWKPRFVCRVRRAARPFGRPVIPMRPGYCPGGWGGEGWPEACCPAGEWAPFCKRCECEPFRAHPRSSVRVAGPPPPRHAPATGPAHVRCRGGFSGLLYERTTPPDPGVCVCAPHVPWWSRAAPPDLENASEVAGCRAKSRDSHEAGMGKFRHNACVLRGPVRLTRSVHAVRTLTRDAEWRSTRPPPQK